MMPPATPIRKSWTTAISFSAVLAVPATPAPKSLIVSIIMSIPKVTIEPGSSRVIQSKRSKGR